jgi:hypothetical protein
MAKPWTCFLQKPGQLVALINLQKENAAVYHLLNIHYTKLQFYPSTPHLVKTLQGTHNAELLAI